MSGPGVGVCCCVVISNEDILLCRGGGGLCDWALIIDEYEGTPIDMLLRTSIPALQSEINRSPLTHDCCEGTELHAVDCVSVGI